ncbi:MAG: flagellar basal body L-ring protein FlgH [bacterium]|nr:flagellar basal body L-ring protein FlgH [bacterium]
MSRSDRGSRALGVVAVAFVALSVGCVETSLREAREPMDYEALPTPPARPTTDGSIWTGATQSGSFLFFDEKAATVGDLVTVVIVEATEAQGDARTETDANRLANVGLSSDVGFQKLVASPIQGLLRIFGFDDEGTGVDQGSQLNVVNSQMQTEFTGEALTSRRGTFTGVITCRVIGVLPNGILHIRGRRSVVVNHEAQYISLEGLVRREDLTIENSVLSNSVAEMRLSYDGMGVLDDKQRPGFMTRFLDWAYPF